MRLWFRQTRDKPAVVERQMAVTMPHHGEPGFSLVEVMVAMLLLGILLIASFGGLFSMDLCSRRLGDHTAAMAIVEAKVQDIRSVYYNPPNSTFGPTTNYFTNSAS